MTKNEAEIKIKELTHTAYQAIREAEQLATDNNLYFTFDLAYGMGGSFTDGSWESASQNC